MKPFSQPGDAGSVSRVFDYHLSRARRVVENAFGRLKARFRILHKGPENDLPNVRLIIRACCVLHNICEDMNATQTGLSGAAPKTKAGLYLTEQRIVQNQVEYKFETQ